MTTFHYQSPDGLVGRKNDDDTFDTLMPDGTWRRGVPDVNEMNTSVISEGEAKGYAGSDVDLEAEPVDIYDPDTRDFVPFKPSS